MFYVVTFSLFFALPIDLPHSE